MSAAPLMCAVPGRLQEARCLLPDIGGLEAVLERHEVSATRGPDVNLRELLQPHTTFEARWGEGARARALQCSKPCWAGWAGWPGVRQCSGGAPAAGICPRQCTPAWARKS